MSVPSGTAFSSDGVDVITRKVESILGSGGAGSGRKCSQSDFISYYEIERCIIFIINNDYQRVALQFPDCLLCDATRVASELTENTSREIFILGDTSYGSCCVDEVAAEHNAADCIIHFGPSCLTRTKRLPVLFVFGREAIDVEDYGRAFRLTFPNSDQHVLMLYDTVYAHCIDELRDSITDYRNCVISQLVLPVSPKQSSLPKPSASEPICVACSCKNSPATSSCTLSSTSSASSYASTLTTCTTSSTPSSSSTSCTTISSTTTSSFSTHPVTSTSNTSTASASSAFHTVTCNRDSCESGCGRDLVTSQSDVSVYVESNTSKSAPREKEESANFQGTNGQSNNTKNTQQFYHRFGRRFQLQCPMELYQVFYIGMEGPTLTNLLLNYSKCQFHTYNPVTRQCRKESVSVNKTLGKRYFLVQKAKEARTVGIIVGTLGAADYLEVIERLKKILQQAGKKYYTIAVGKLNVPKIANFLEIDIFVLVACPENSLVDSQDFFKPVITPYELELACLRSKEWTGEYSTDYQELLPGACFHSALDKVEDEMEPEFSLITGGFVPTKHSSQTERHGKALKARSNMEVAQTGSAASYLQMRSWQGLEQKLGETEVGVAMKGRTGIASAYSHEQLQQ